MKAHDQRTRHRLNAFRARKDTGGVNTPGLPAPGRIDSHGPAADPLPPDLVPDATGLEAFEAACKEAMQQQAVFIAVERQGPRWTVKADPLTAPQHAISTEAYEAIREAVIHLIRTRQIRPASSAGPVYFVLYDLEGEDRARELAAALHAALYGDPGPLASCLRSS
ncbi:hypothetical protein ACWC9U_19020 [Streptomyces sp. 900116325]